MYACVDEKMKSMHEFKQKHKKLQLRNVCKGHCEVKGKVLKTGQLLHEAWKLQMKAAELSSENIKKMEAVTAEWFASIFFLRSTVVTANCILTLTMTSEHSIYLLYYAQSLLQNELEEPNNWSPTLFFTLVI